MAKSKYYYDYTRNTGEVIDYKQTQTPNYYIGKKYGYKAKDIIYDYDLSYNCGTALTYILRAGTKTEQGMNQVDKHIEDLQKAINHLSFEIENLQKEGDQ